MYDNIKILKLRFLLKAFDKIQLPEYTGSTFRGAFGYAFKNATCIMRKERLCENCIVKLSCSYYSFFESPLPETISEDKLKFLKLSNVKKIPHPFIFEPDIKQKRILNKDDLFFFDLILFGKANEYYPYFIFSIIEMGKKGIGINRGKYVLEKVLNFVNDSKTELIFDSGSNVLSKINNYFVPLNQNITEDIIKLNFITPLRLQQEGKLVNNPDFKILIINLIRKISAMLFFHYNYDFDADYIKQSRELIEKSGSIQTLESNLKWYSWERWSNRQKTKMNLGGLVGEISFQGNLSPFSELINLGKYFHVGKNTVFGLGKYLIK